MNHANFNRSFFGAGLLVLMLLALALGGERVATFLEYDRAAILGGQWWRVLTAHLIHAGVAHLLLNLAGLALVLRLFGRLLPLRRWILSLGVCMVGVSAGQLFFCPELQWYRGFSGVLHGFMVVGLVAAIQQHGQQRALGFYGLALLSGKLLVELLVGPTGASVLSPDTPVIVEAHLFGALAGVLVILCAARFSRAVKSVCSNGCTIPRMASAKEASLPAHEMPR